MPRKRQAEPAAAASGDRRALILRHAAAMFAELGYTETTTRALAERAKVSEGLIFHHFGSKMGLFRALAAGSRPDRLVAALERARSLPLAELPTFLADAWTGDAREAGFVASLARDATRDPEVREFVAAVVAAVVAGLEAVLRERVAAGELPPDLDLVLASEVLQQVLLGHSIHAAVTRPRRPLSARLALVLAGLRGSSGPAPAASARRS